MRAYLDHAACTPLRPGVLEAMLPWLTTEPGNPSGSHRAARQARRAIDDARDAVAALAGARPGEVIFTSGGTEPDTLAVFGTVGTVGTVRTVGTVGTVGIGSGGPSPASEPDPASGAPLVLA